MKRKQQIKIKRRKYNLYTKKKSTASKVWTVVIMVIIVIGLCVLGYGLGRPIVDYFQNRDNNPDNTSAWTPPQSTTTAAPDTTSDTTTEDNTSAQPEPELTAQEGAYILPENAAESAERLARALDIAKQNGSTAVVVTFKDSDGDFMYKTEISGVKDTPLVLGSLTAKEIYDAVAAEGLTPMARICTLKDHKSGSYVEGIRFLATEGWTWLDNYAEQGGKSWLSPFEPNTADFIASITTEVAQAGFKQIILSDTVFPAFRDADYGYLANIDNTALRAKSLWSVIDASSDAAASSGAEVLIEVDGDALFSSERLSTTAEIAADAAKLSSTRLLIDFSGAGYSEAKAFIGKMNASYSGANYSILLSGVSPTAAEEIEKAFVETDITVFSE